ncbi:MAG: ABC transporter ATP-binding protein [Myxococcales bacterium]
MIEAKELTKHFKVHKRPPGFGAAVRSLFRRKHETVVAVDGVSFSIAPGERVGFLGPNGAGKTTTLKMLSGLLHPTSGELTVAGFTPRHREPAFLKQITLVMGQKQQLLWDLPPAETFDLNRAIYDVPLRQFRETLAEMTELLELGDLISKPTRQLSLGERMKCELAASLLHRPSVLFLDEPTIGLDVSMQATVRSFVRTYNQRYGATVLLTSHYMEDVAALCPRVIIIDHGRLVHDGPLEALVHQIKPHKRIAVRLSAPVAAAQLEGLGQLISQDEAQVVLQVPHEGLPESVSRVLSRLPVVDLSIEDPPLEEVFREIYKHPATFLPQERP